MFYLIYSTYLIVGIFIIFLNNRIIFKNKLYFRVEDDFVLLVIFLWPVCLFFCFLKLFEIIVLKIVKHDNDKYIHKDGYYY